MKKVFLALFSFLLLFPGLSYSQNRVQDSLKQILSESKTLDDSLEALCQLSWSISDSNPGLTFIYAMKAFEKRKRITSKLRLSDVYDAAALGHWVKGDRKKAWELYHTSLDIGIKYNIPNRIAWANYHLGELSELDGRTSDVINYAVKARNLFQSFNDMRMVIYSDWLIIRTSKNNSNPYLDSTINDYKLAESFTTAPEVLLDQYLNLAFLYGQKENRSISMQYALKAMEIAEAEKNQKGLFKAYFSIADYLRDYQRNYEVALLYYKKILEICERDKYLTGKTTVLNDMGILYKLMGNYKSALENFSKSLDIAQKIKHRHSIARAYEYLGDIAKEKREYSKALDYYTKCYETGCNECSILAFHDVLINTGNVYLNTNDYGNAQKYYNKSLAIADSLNALPQQAISYSALGELHEKLGEYREAEIQLSKAWDYAVKANSLELRKNIASKLSNIYKQKNDFQKAFKFLNISQVLEDSLNKLSTAENLSRLETKFEFQNLKLQKELELKESQMREDRQAQLKYFFIVGFVLALVLGFVIYISLQRKKADNIILAEQKEKLQEMSQKIHEADQKRISFFTNISHELRTPLTLILGPVEKLLRENSTDKSSTPLLGIVRRNTLHLHNLINQLLDIRKLDTGNLKLKVKYGDFTAYCKGVYSIFIHLAEENNINYIFTSSPEKINGWFDSDIIEKTLNNLLSNAFKYTPNGGNISLLICKESLTGNGTSYIKIIVKDNGKGIPDDQIQYVFDRYYQVENNNTGFNTGTGIGLAYTKELIQLHKGNINVESQLGDGSVFTIELPVEESYYSENEKTGVQAVQTSDDKNDIRQKYLEEMIMEETLIDKQNMVKETPAENGDSKIMLLVEDNPDLREFIKTIFADDYSIYEAPDGLKGLSMANEMIPDIIISDIMMPGMDGLQLSSKLKSSIHTNHIPLLILTAKIGIENEIEGLQTGADDYLTKPFNSEILKIRVNRLLEAKKNLREYFVKEFLLNPKEVKLDSPADEFLKKAVQVVEDNISNPDLNVELLMDRLCVSRMQLHRKLKAVTNLSANVFIRNIKLKRAAQLLQQNSRNITEVLYESGFNSPSYFTSCFKEMYGCLPKEYAKLQKHAELPN